MGVYGRINTDLSPFVCVSVHVAEAVDHDDPGYLEALQQETIILEKRVEMCQSRIMLVTCFDINI